MSSKRSGPNPLHGILLVDKPAGWTSHDVVARVRRLTGQRKIGHTGTLDPMATGLLVLCLGDATRLVEYMSGHEKRYEGVVTLGTTTDTDDAEGTVISTRAVPALDATMLDQAFDGFRGRKEQLPPAYSALKVGGQRAYALARKGTAPELAARAVTIHELTGRLVDERRVWLAIRCSAGTYIRSIARDLGEALGCGGHLSELRRTHAGQFSVENAVTLELVERAGTDRAHELLWAIDEGLRGWDAAILGEDHVAAFVQGVSFEYEAAHVIAAGNDLTRVFSSDGDFAGVGALMASGRLKPVKVMAQLRESVSIMSGVDSQTLDKR